MIASIGYGADLDTTMTQPLSPFDHIQKIRQEKYGILPDNRSSGKNALSRSLQKAIEHLSEGLYSSGAHFVFELIQNAEDNQYRADVTPDLTFILLDEDPLGIAGHYGALVLINNEIGFQPNQVEAICDVGGSTKSKAQKQQGYIGEKGIGFKSVFVVSKQPHIFSNGYQFAFDEAPHPLADLGYIVPTWIADPPEISKHYQGKTVIILPLKKGKLPQIKQELQAISVETILFLNKLNALTIRQAGESVSIRRNDTNLPLVRLVSDAQERTYWVAEQEFVVPAELKEEKRIGVIERKVTIAFPLATDDLDDRVFAFLPTKDHSGLPFLINADFILTANREQIQFEREWNQWLRDCIVDVFIEAFEAMLADPTLRIQAYRFIPLLEQVQRLDASARKFFASVVDCITVELQERAIIWTQTDEWVYPSSARLSSGTFRQLFAQSPCPEQLTHTPLIHPTITVYEKQLRAIGLQEIAQKEIIACLQDDGWLNDRPLSWFAELYGYLAHECKWIQSHSLQHLRLLMLEDGSLVNGWLDQPPVYFPLDHQEYPDPFWKQHEAIVRLGILQADLYQLIENDEDLLDWLIGTLHIYPFSLNNYCVDLSNALSKIEKIDKRTLLQITRLFRDQYYNLDVSTQDLIHDKLLLITDNGVSRRNEDKIVVMPKALDPKLGWHWVFPEPTDRAGWIILSDSYLEGCDEEEIQAWRRFFVKMGATDTPLPQPQKTSWVNDVPHEISGVAKNFLRQFQQRTTANHKIIDYRAPAWLCKASAKQQSTHDRRSLALCQWLQQRNGLASLPSASYDWHYYSWQSKNFDSEFKAYVLRGKWFPTTKGLRQPNETFIDKPELREVFGDTLPYARFQPHKSVIDLLGIRTEATGEQILTYLRDLAQQSPETVSVDLVTKIYSFLSNRTVSNLKEQFQQERLILATTPKPCWITVADAIWPDLSEVFGQTYVYLSTQYPDLRQFFVTQLGIRERLDEETYADAWVQLSKQQNPPSDDVKAAMERIYLVLNGVAGQQTKPSWWEKLIRNDKIWAQSGRFVSSRQVYIPDDSELKRLFSSKNIEFAWRPPKASFADYHKLYEALGVQSLSSQVQTSVQSSQLFIEHQVLPLLTDAAKRAICYYLKNTNTFAIVYEALRQNGLLESLLRTKELVVDNLTVIHNLPEQKAQVTNSQSVAYWEPEKHVLYRLAGKHDEPLDVEIPSALARRLLGARAASSNDLENFIGRVLGATAAKAENIIQKRDWTLPKEDLEWIEAILATLHKTEVTPAEAENTESADADAEEFVSSADTEQVIDESEERLDGQRVSPATQWPTSHNGHARSTTSNSTANNQAATPERQSSRQPYSDHDSSKTSTDQSSNPQPSLERRFSYTEPKSRQDEEDNSLPQGRSGVHADLDVAEAGVQFVIAYEKAHQRHPLDVNVDSPNHKGWDIESYEIVKIRIGQSERESRQLTRHIEVKSTKDGWGGWGVEVTPAQHQAAYEKGDSYYLYVVEYALEPQRRKLYVFRNPVATINRYLFDHKWKLVADETYKDSNLLC